MLPSSVRGTQITDIQTKQLMHCSRRGLTRSTVRASIHVLLGVMVSSPQATWEEWFFWGERRVGVGRSSAQHESKYNYCNNIVRCLYITIGVTTDEHNPVTPVCLSRLCSCLRLHFCWFYFPATSMELCNEWPSFIMNILFSPFDLVECISGMIYRVTYPLWRESFDSCS